MIRNALWVLAFSAAAVLGCKGSSSARPPTPTQTPTPPSTIVVKPGAPIIIGVSSALSGDQATLGGDIANAAELAIADRGGMLRAHGVEVRRMDDGCGDAEKSVTAARAFVKIDGLAGVVGPMCTTGAQAADAAYEAAHIVHILPAATRADLSEQGEQYLFRTAWRDDAQAAVQATYAAHDFNAMTAVLIDDGEPYGKTLGDAFVTAYEATGGRVLSRERVSRGATDFTPAARQVKSADPAVVVFEGQNPEASLALAALREAGYKGNFIAPDGVLNAGAIASVRPEITNGVIVTGGATPDGAFVSRFHDRFGHDPATPFALQSHDAVSLLLGAIDAVASDRADGALVIDREQLAAKLHGQMFTGLTGSIRFAEHGDRQGESAAELGLSIYRVANGRLEFVR